MATHRERMYGIHCEDQLRTTLTHLIEKFSDQQFRRLRELLELPDAPTMISHNDWWLVSALATLQLKSITSTLAYKEE